MIKKMVIFVFIMIIPNISYSQNAELMMTRNLSNIMIFQMTFNDEFVFIYADYNLAMYHNIDKDIINKKMNITIDGSEEQYIQNNEGGLISFKLDISLLARMKKSRMCVIQIEYSGVIEQYIINNTDKEIIDIFFKNLQLL